MVLKFKHLGSVMVLVAVLFLWCQSAQAMMMPEEASMMNCSQTMMCGVCAVALHSVSPVLNSPPPEIRMYVEVVPKAPAPHPVPLYHPPR
ncbi:exported hypothetical protein [Nitrospina gracilis 3/211]|uniref:Uncharacterized protein n=1 Tax=Nitrospina gracilis (strain 3/211) TaxID=1266370 RepID=M1Z1J2_NITG3|nr:MULTISPECIES: hypothetical protein [Nitrospina]MCF8724439.1 putative membrane protein YadS [Nitrospina sp. Nb-3]CCQ91597.1 exported hypothetical protein [Nitrospina gracilis 3/211]